ncbi:sigma-70 family RNA polymerase sigma factor [Microbacterium sulfonylureivorans]|uniref:sigma-70 family RNA polymerase sigma factor n=1 Tax=Microbacterium sulfonylureivorans TaxID=2486854 RepID=UPI000FDB1118|nr:sigma-70 family RNA polymerase sigma factor [Microbacterium sulfonylureivorans]
MQTEHDDDLVDETVRSDSELVDAVRAGDSNAYAELWRRHYRAGVAAARAVTGTFDADDLVQESFTAIYQAIRKGKGPTSGFRPYLLASVRNTAAGWGRAKRESADDQLDLVADPSSSDRSADDAFDRTLTVGAFRSLPTRWQEVLWYTEVEQMKPAEVAPLLGLRAAAVSQLAFRAREGLREAWIQGHLRSLDDKPECEWTVAHLGAYARENASRRDVERVRAHLDGCARCVIVAEEAGNVSSRIALVLLPLALGVAGAGGYLASLQTTTSSAVAMAVGGMPASTIPPAPAPPRLPRVRRPRRIDGSAPDPGGVATWEAAGAVGRTAALGSHSGVAGATALGLKVAGTAAAAVLVAGGGVTAVTLAIGANATASPAPPTAGGMALESEGEVLPQDDLLEPVEQLVTPERVASPPTVHVPVATPQTPGEVPLEQAPYDPPTGSPSTPKTPAVPPAEPETPEVPPVEPETPVDPPVEPETPDPVPPVLPVVGPEWTYGIVEDNEWNDLLEPRADIELFADAFAQSGTTVEFVVGGVVQLTKVVDETGRVSFWHVMYLDEVTEDTPVTLRYLIDGQPGPETSYTVAQMRSEVGSGAGQAD